VKAPLPEQQKHLTELDAQVEARRKNLPSFDHAPRKWKPKTDWSVKQGMVFEAQTKGSYNGDAAEFGYLQPFTFSAWIKPASPDGAILTRLDDYIESQGHGLYLINGKVRLHLTHRFTDLGLRVETVEPVKLNQWQHVVATYDGKRMASGVHIYIDGEAQETKILFDQNNEPFQKKHTNIRVGEGGGLKFDGEIADARIYKRALTSQEAAAVSVKDPIAKLAGLNVRTNAQQAKVDLAYLDLAAPESIKNAFAGLAKSQAEHDAYYDSIPTVMKSGEIWEIWEIWGRTRAPPHCRGDHRCREVRGRSRPSRVSVSPPSRFSRPFRPRFSLHIVGESQPELI
jgi:hypothetical protein